MVSNREFMRSQPLIAFFALLLSAFSSAQKPQQAPNVFAPKSILPADFSGWHRINMRPWVPGAADGFVDFHAGLNEYGVQESLEARYDRGDRTLTVIAHRVGDATGAYGDFTFRRRPGLAAEK